MPSVSVVAVVCLLLLLGVAGLSVGVLLHRRGGFPNSHVSGNEAMRNKGIGCAQTQDRQAQRGTPKINVKEL